MYISQSHYKTLVQLISVRYSLKYEKVVCTYAKKPRTTIWENWKYFLINTEIAPQDLVDRAALCYVSMKIKLPKNNE